MASVPDRLFRVSWRRAKWAAETKPNQRLYLRHAAAVAFARKLADAAAAKDELIGITIDCRDLVPGGWVDIEELEQ